MPDATPLVVDDLSRFARALGRALADRHAAGEAPPGHVALLNLIARAAGWRPACTGSACRCPTR
jgi:hypothetical protein